MAEVNKYYPGQEIVITALFKRDGVLTDPTTVTFKTRDPLGAKTTYVYLTDEEVIRDSVGSYYLAFVAPETEGSWWARAASTGTVNSALETWFEVLPTRFPVVVVP